MATSTKASKQNQDNSTTARAAAAAHDAVDRAAGSAERAEERAREAAHEAGRRAEEAIGSVQSFVKERPVAALGIAFVAGALAASWLRR